MCLLLVIRKYAVRLINLLEFFFSTRILAYIGMKLPCEVAVCLLDLLIISTTGYSEDIVVVAAYRNSISPHRYWKSILSVISEYIVVVSRTHECSLFFYIIVSIDNGVIRLFILLR